MNDALYEKKRKRPLHVAYAIIFFGVLCAEIDTGLSLYFLDDTNKWGLAFVMLSFVLSQAIILGALMYGTNRLYCTWKNNEICDRDFEERHRNIFGE